MIRRLLVSLGVLPLATALSPAQGTLSTQGFGYPAGGLSTRAGATGGALAEFDFASARNPSSLLGWGRGGMYFQYEPEFRSVRSEEGNDRSTTARFPLIMAAVQLGSRVMAGFSSTTLLDRTWVTRVRATDILGSEIVGFDETVESNGSINDLRFAAAYSVSTSFSMGIGIHAITGENRMSLVRQFDDTVRYGALVRRLTIGYSGTGLSFGATWRPHRTFALAASMRHGGDLDLRVANVPESSARVPSRFGAAARFDGIAGTSLVFSAERTTWSRMSELGSSALAVRDGWDYGAGAELSGPRVRGFTSSLYLGYRQRDLPFSIGSSVVERFVTSGIELPLAGPRVLLDIGVQRASRGSVGAISETAWLASFGFAVRP